MPPDNLLNDAQIAWVIAARVMLIPSRKTYRDAGRIAIGHRLLGECDRTGLVSDTQRRNIHESLRTSISSPRFGWKLFMGKDVNAVFFYNPWKKHIPHSPSKNHMIFTVQESIECATNTWPQLRIFILHWMPWKVFQNPGPVLRKLPQVTNKGGDVAFRKQSGCLEWDQEMKYYGHSFFLGTNKIPETWKHSQ